MSAYTANNILEQVKGRQGIFQECNKRGLKSYSGRKTVA